MVPDSSENRRPHRAARWAAGLAGLACLAATATAADFECAALKPSASKAPAYARVANQPRCEGFYDRNVSQPFIELVSLTSGALPSAEAPTMLLAASQRGAARLTVHPLRPAPFYRVDASVAAGQSVAWDAGPMLAATGLRVRDLGFLALLGGSVATDTFVPVAFSATLAAKTPAAPIAADRPAELQAVLQAVLRVSVPVASLAWRRQRLDGGDDGAGAWREVPGPARFAWERVPFALEMPADGRGVRVDVQALDADSKVLPLLRFNVSGPADAGS